MGVGPHELIGPAGQETGTLLATVANDAPRYPQYARPDVDLKRAQPPGRFRMNERKRQSLYYCLELLLTAASTKQLRLGEEVVNPFRNGLRESPIGVARSPAPIRNCVCAGSTKVGGRNTTLMLLKFSNYLLHL